VATGGELPNGCQCVKFTVRGMMKNARTHVPVPGVLVKIDGLESTTSAGGIYDIEGVCIGKRTIEYSKDGYYASSIDTTVVANTDVGGPADADIIQIPDDSIWTVTLSHTSDDDLDLEANWADKKVFYGDRGPIQTDDIFVTLAQDFDPKSSSETLAISNVGSCNTEPLSYHCRLNLKVRSSSDMSQSGAVAKLLQGETVKEEFKISDCLEFVTQGGKWWHVFTLDLKENTLKLKCNEPGMPSLLQESAMSIPDKSSNHNLVPGKREVDFTSYLGPFPGRFFRHSIKRSKNRTSSVGKKLRAAPSAIHKKTASLTQSVKASAMLSKPSSTSRSTKHSSTTGDKSYVQMLKTNPNARIIRGKLTTEPSPVEQSASLLAKPDSTVSSTIISSTSDVRDVSTGPGPVHGDISLKVEPSEVDIRPRGHHGLQPHEPTTGGLRPDEPTTGGLRPDEPTTGGLRPDEPTTGGLRPGGSTTDHPQPAHDSRIKKKKISPHF